MRQSEWEYKLCVADVDEGDDNYGNDDDDDNDDDGSGSETQMGNDMVNGTDGWWICNSVNTQ